MAKSDTKTNNFLDIAANGTRADVDAAKGCCNTRTQDLVLEVAERIMDVEDEVERLENNPDVVDIVATYADLEAYDTTGLTDKDVIRVLEDETHDGGSTYYRWSTITQTWTYIGESKQYSDFVGTDGTGAGEAGLVPAPEPTDAGKFLGASGDWEEIAPGPEVVQDYGSSTTSVMSQYAVTRGLFTDPNIRANIAIGLNATSTGASVSIGNTARSGSAHMVSIGELSNTTFAGDAAGAIGVGWHASGDGRGAIGLGAYSQAVGDGVMHIGTSSIAYGYRGSNYRLLTGLYDPQGDHDAANKEYVDAAVTGLGESVDQELSTNYYTKAEVDALIGNLEAALNAINNGGSN